MFTDIPHCHQDTLEPAGMEPQAPAGADDRLRACTAAIGSLAHQYEVLALLIGGCDAAFAEAAD